MENNLAKAKKMLEEGEYTCVVCNGKIVYTSNMKGVKPLVTWYENNMNFANFSAADKVVGKGAAFLYVLLGIKEIYAGVISKSALDLLVKNGIYVEYGITVNNIINRKGDGICPFEEAVLELDDKEKAYRAINKKMEELK